MHAPRRPRSALRGRLRRSAAIAAADITSRLTRSIGRHGTALPGLVASRIDPAILASVGGAFGPVILVIGTNGKTTTTRLTATVVERALGVRPVSNRSGANLVQGILTAILADGRPATRRRPAVFEVDELAFPSVTAAIRPNVVVILNLVRDQLDRFGEIDEVERQWTDALGRLPPDTRLVVCADDPRVETIARRADLPVWRFGLVGHEPGARSESTGFSGESIGARCPSCGAPTAVGDASMSLGPWQCGACGLRRSPLDLGVRMADIDRPWLCLDFSAAAPDTGTAAGNAASEPAVARVGLTGTAGAHDAAAAILAAMALGIPLASAVAALDGATPAFGRLEEIAVDGRRVVLTLAKNPASAAQAAEAVAEWRPDGVLIGLGDRAADGRDVSWIWDARIDGLARLAPLTLTGDRADDLAIRFKYAEQGVDGTRRPVVEPGIEHALAASLRSVRPGGMLMVLGTYTTLLGIRQLLERRGLAAVMPR